MSEVMTRGDLARQGIEAIDKIRAGEIAISREAGGVQFSSAVEVMEFAKMLSTGGGSIPEHLRSNPGVCLRVVFQAIEWGVSPYAVADQSYIVSGKMAYMAQLIHAIVSARAPLAKALETEYFGEGPTRRIKVTGTFLNGDVREYESPMFKDIKVKNSPLWTGDLDQQLHYFGVRSWARRWVSHVLFGIYTPEEVRAGMGASEIDGDPVVPLKDRLQGRAEGAEGHRHGHADRELSNIVPDAKVEILPAGGEEPASPAAPGGKSRAKAGPKGRASSKAPKAGATPSPKAVDHAANKAGDAGRAKDLTNPSHVAPKSAASAAADRAQATSDAKKAAHDQANPPLSAAACKTPAQYAIYLRAYIAKTADGDEIEARWDGERDIRDDLSVSILLRKELEREVNARVEELRK